MPFEETKFTSNELTYSIPAYKNTPLPEGGRYEDYFFYN